MARPKKNNADYFSHDADMRNDAKIKALRRKFGIEGYGIYNMIIEHLTDSDFFEYELNDLNIELLSGDFDIETVRLQSIIDYCKLLKLLSVENGILYSQKLKDRLQSLINKRERQSKEKSIKEELFKSKAVIANENPQSKVKYSKVEESKEKKKMLFDTFWDLYPKKIAKAKVKGKFLKLSMDDVKKILSTVNEFINYKPFPTYTHPNPETYINQRRWEDEIPTAESKVKKLGVSNQINLPQYKHLQKA